MASQVFISHSFPENFLNENKSLTQFREDAKHHGNVHTGVYAFGFITSHNSWSALKFLQPGLI